ncbi:MAG: Biotin/lipoate protein ligase [Bryobacterales bacterium]|nr:Biotin/lipoate protein ligase [Bryobacterales bacterium]
MLRVVDHSFESPDENLAFDDGLVHDGCETLRFWESPVHFVVLGRSGSVAREVNVTACEAASIRILRRSSGGGTVLQGPGCLNYALALSLADRPALVNITDSYRIILDRIARGVGVAGLDVCGSDILLEARKVSGNAQRRTKDWLLHNGTILHGLNITLMERLLFEPQRQPPYRGGRAHRQFVTNLNISPRELKHRLIRAWSNEQCPRAATTSS